MFTQVTLQLTGKRKQALLESNLPGISCSTGMVKESVGNTNLSFKRIIPRVECLKKLNQKNSLSNAVFILLSGSKNGGAYNVSDRLLLFVIL